MKLRGKFISLFIILVFSISLPFAISFTMRIPSLEQNVILVVIFIIGALAFILISRRITYSISQLLDGMDVFLRGDFTQRIKLRSKDEIGELTDAFNQLAEMLNNNKKELEKIKGKLRSSTKELKNRISELSALNRATKILNSTLDLKKKYKLIVDTAISVMGAKKGLLIFADQEGDKLDVKCMQGEDVRLELHRELARWVIRNNEPFLLDGKAKDLQFKGLVEEKDTGAIMCVPLETKDGLTGVISVEHPIFKEEFTQNDLELFSTFVNEVALVLENAFLTDTLIESRELDSFNRITSVIIHDLKGSISGLSLLLANTEQNYDDPEFRADLVTTIADTVKKIEDLVARLNSNPHLLELKSESINRIIQNIIDRLDLRKAEDIELIEEYEELPNLMIDEKNMERVFKNLILNALEAMPNGGKLRITSRKEENPLTAVVEITDTGYGMTEEFINNGLFKPFRTTKRKGLGLGLFSCREIISLHGGKIEVKSKPGKGTTFAVRLPILAIDGRLKAIRKLLGEYLLEEGTISEVQLEKALKIQSSDKRRIGRILIDLGYVEEQEIVSVLERQKEAEKYLCDILSRRRLSNEIGISC